MRDIVFFLEKSSLEILTFSGFEHMTSSTAKEFTRKKPASNLGHLVNIELTDNGLWLALLQDMHSNCR